MGNVGRHRATLWLRGERAFGLESVRRVDGVGQDVAEVDVARSSVAEELPRPLRTPPREPASPAPPARERTTTRAGPEARFGAGAMTSQPPARLAELPPFDVPVLPREQKVALLQAMDEKEVRTCQRCRLCETRTHTVFGEGDPDAKILFIGEGPGENEDLTGRPFVGKAGQLLEKMINAMGLARAQVFIVNIVKCRPPDNRVPAPDEVSACTPYLLRQIEVIRPAVIVTLGLPSARYMLQSTSTMGKLRGQWQTWRGIKLMPTFHPSYVLRSYTPEVRAAVWGDLQQVMAAVGLPSVKKAEGT